MAQRQYKRDKVGRFAAGGQVTHKAAAGAGKGSQSFSMKASADAARVTLKIEAVEAAAGKAGEVKMGKAVSAMVRTGTGGAAVSALASDGKSRAQSAGAKEKLNEAQAKLASAANELKAKAESAKAEASSRANNSLKATGIPRPSAGGMISAPQAKPSEQARPNQDTDR